MSAWYRTGTVTATNGSGAVTGNLTAWLANAKVGDAFTFDADSKVYEITAVSTNTGITISPVYAGSTGSGKAYGINRTSTAWNSASELSVQIAQFISTFDPLGLSQLSDPNADRIPFWDESSGTAGAMAWLTLSGLGISGTTMSVDTNLISTARWTQSALTAATTTDIGSETSPYVTVSGNTGITSLGNQINRFRIVRFTGTPTITHNGTTLILPNAANLSVLSGSVHAFASDSSGNWRWLWSNEIATLTTAAGRALLDDATGSDQLTTLGVSTYIKTLLDDANAATAQVTLGVREVLAVGRTYYVRADGSDSNTGLVNSAGGAFLTIQKAVDVAAASLDTAGFTVTVTLAASTTYAETVTLKPLAGGGLLSIVGAGNSTIVSPASGNCFQGTTGGRFLISNLRVTRSSGSGHGVLAQNGTVITCTGVEFGSLAAGRHVFATQGGVVLLNSAYTINGGAQMHWSVSSGGYIQSVNTTITISSTPAFSSRFADAFLCGSIQCNGNTFSGSATGVRYLADTNGAIYTAGGGASFLPGNSAGSVTNGGAYV